MNLTASKITFSTQIEQFSPKTNIVQRTLALYAAAITFGDDAILTQTINKSQKLGLTFTQLYETVLMSYLLLGFPRMLIAVHHLSKLFPAMKNESNLNQKFTTDTTAFVERGEALCRKIYKDKYEVLHHKIASTSPEIFEWMITEGYGKVLSREGLDVQFRELCVVSFLMMENRYHQLYAHIRGSINVGVEFDVLKEVIEDLRLSSGEGYDNAKKIIEELRNK